MTEYYDRYTRAGGWKALKFRPGHGLQSAEINELQSVLHDEMHQLGRTVWADGQVVRGFELTLPQGGATLARVSAGQIYFDGYFQDFPGGTIDIAKSGLEVIGIRITPVVIDEADDPALHDPASGWENAGYAGAHRLIYTLALALDDASAVALFAVQDGYLSADYRPQPSASDLAATLARRTYDESGDYLVRGLRCSVADHVTDPAKYWLMIGAGKAYVSGNEFTIPSVMRLLIDRPTETGSVQDEPKTFATGTNTYSLNRTPVKQITRVSATVQASVSMSRGSTPNGMDAIPLDYSPAISVVSLTAGATTYTSPADFSMVPAVSPAVGEAISWAAGGSEPSSGTPYTLVLRYTKAMLADDDYTLTGDAIDFSPDGANPVNGTVVDVDYDYYLPRHDTVVMNPRGEMRIIKGTPGVYAVAPKPPPSTLPIAYVHLAANVAAASAQVEHADRFRLTMHELARLRDRIEDLEYNAAVTDLEQAAINVELPTSKKAIFTDSFRNAEKIAAVDGLACAIGMAGDGLDTLYPDFAANFFSLSTGPFRVRTYTGSLAVVSQDYATNTINANPHAAYNIAGKLTLNPNADIWTQTVTVQTTTNTTVTHGAGAVKVREWWVQWTDKTLVSDTAISATSNAKWVAIAGAGYYPGSDNLVLNFNGTRLAMTPTGSTLKGTDQVTYDGGVQANSAGAFTASFVVPAGTPSGKHSITVSNLQNTGQTQYLIDGRLQTWLEATTLQRHVELVDPVAQSFTVPFDLFARAVDLFFAAKPTTGPGVTVSIRNMVNGYPGTLVLAEATLTPSQVSVSDNGAAQTRVTFAEPAYLQSDTEYAVVVGSLSNAYYLHYAKLGGTDRVSGDVVVANPVTGVMFSSANASTWTAYQEQDLKVHIVRATFGTAETVIDFGLKAVSGSGVTIMGSEIVPEGTKVIFEAKWNDTGAWVPVPLNTRVDAGVMLSTLRVRARLLGTDILTPVLAGQIGLVVDKWMTSGQYVSRNTELDAYTSLRLYVDLDLPAGTSITPYYSVDAGTSWSLCGAAVSSRVVNAPFSEFEYHVTGLSSPSQLMLRLDMACSADRLRAPRVRRLRAIAVE